MVTARVAAVFGSFSVRKTFAHAGLRRSSVTSPSTQTFGSRPRYHPRPRLKADTVKTLGWPSTGWSTFGTGPAYSRALEEDLGGRHGVAAAREQLDGVVEIDLARGDALRQVNGIPGLEQDVQPPALHLRRLVLVPERGLGRLGHARAIRRSQGHPFQSV